MRIDIKPLSVNEVWQGKRFKTRKYTNYEKDMLHLLPNIKVPKYPLKIEITWGFSSVASDIDNPTKPFLDVLQKKYGFDDKMIYELILHKTLVKRGFEFIEFTISEKKIKKNQ
jgi:Holliday junction resolvase RusA-like endonuclease